MPKTKEPKLTIKQANGATALTKEGLRYLLRLYEIAYSVDLSMEYAKLHPRRSKPVMIGDTTKCRLCEETKTLDRAHIIPIAITNKIHVDGAPIEFLKHAIALCPTHHRQYDKYQLDETHKSILKDFIKRNKYDLGLAYTLEGIELLNVNSRTKIDIGRRLDIAWNWWREYCYGN